MVEPSSQSYTLRKMNTLSHVAFLRGINVGGNALIKMTDLKKAFETLSLHNVSTLLASGNVVFESPEVKAAELKQRIERMLARRFGLHVTAILRRAQQIADLLKSNPFPRGNPKAQTKIHVTFLAKETNQHARFPLRLAAEGFQVLQVSNLELVCAVDLSSNLRTPELMKWLEKEFGKKLTTRTWDTVEKLGKLLNA